MSQSAPVELKLNPKEGSFRRIPSIGLEGIFRCVRVEIPLANLSSWSYTSLMCPACAPRYGFNRKGAVEADNTSPLGRSMVWNVFLGGEDEGAGGERNVSMSMGF